MTDVANDASDSLRLGAAYMCIAMLMTAGADVWVKALAGSYPTAQIVLLRIALALPLVLVFCHAQGGIRSLLRPRWGWQCYRGLLAAGCCGAGFMALCWRGSSMREVTSCPDGG